MIIKQIIDRYLIYYQTSLLFLSIFKISFYSKIEQYTKEILNEEKNNINETINENILRDSVVIGFTPKEIEKRTLTSLLEDDEESMWNKVLNAQKNNHM